MQRNRITQQFKPLDETFYRGFWAAFIEMIAGQITDAGHVAVFNAIRDDGFRKYTETEIAGIAALGMRSAGSVWEWSFTGGNEIASGYRTGFMGGACTPPTEHRLQAGEALMVDLHATFRLGLGDHTHNYLLALATPRQHCHARNFVDLVSLVLQTYKAGISPSSPGCRHISTSWVCCPVNMTLRK